MSDYQEFWVIFNDGSQDWVSPVVSIEETDAQIIVNNGAYDYKYEKIDIKHHSVVDIIK